MKRRFLSAVLGLLTFAVSPLPAQTTNSESVAPTKVIHEKTVRVGGDVSVGENESAREVVVIGGNATIRGRVRGNALVVAGTADVTGTVEGDLIVVAGTVKLGPKAQVKKSLIALGSTMRVDPAAQIDESRVEMALGRNLQNLGWLANWVNHGLVAGRPFPPRLGWAWGWALLFLLVHLLLAALFPSTAQTSMDTLQHRPVGSLLTGLLVLLLMGPLVTLLVVSGVGLLILPFFLCALTVALLFGKIALYQFAGRRIAQRLRRDFTQRPLAALAVGTVVFYVLYMVPLAGFLVLGVVTMLAVGAATLAALSSLRREASPAASGTASPAGTVLAAAAGASVPPVLDVALLPRAGFWWRLLATLIDLCLLLVVLVPLKKIWLLVWLTYHVILWVKKGTTVGGLLLGLKIVREDGRPVGWGAALVRAFSAILSALALFLGFFWAGWSRDKRAWHDRFAGTIVVKLPKDGAPG